MCLGEYSSFFTSLPRHPQEAPASRGRRRVDESKTSCLLHLHADHLYYNKFKSVQAVVAQVEICSQHLPRPDFDNTRDLSLWWLVQQCVFISDSHSGNSFSLSPAFSDTSSGWCTYMLLMSELPVVWGPREHDVPRSIPSMNIQRQHQKATGFHQLLAV